MNNLRSSTEKCHHCRNSRDFPMNVRLNKHDSSVLIFGNRVSISSAKAGKRVEIIFFFAMLSRVALYLPPSLCGATADEICHIPSFLLVSIPPWPCSSSVERCPEEAGVVSSTLTGATTLRSLRRASRGKPRACHLFEAKCASHDSMF